MTRMLISVVIKEQKHWSSKFGLLWEV